MKKNELIKRVAYVSGKPQDVVRHVLDATAAVVRKAVSKGDSVFLFGLGVLRVVERGEKMARNLHTGDKVVVPPRRVVVLRPSDSVNDAANLNG